MNDGFQIDKKALLQAFMTESEEALARIEQLLVQLDSGAADSEQCGELFRLVHTLKGSAAIVGIEELAAVAHAAEDLLDDVRAGRVQTTRPVVDCLFAVLDEFRNILTGASTGDHSAILEQIKRTRTAQEELGHAPSQNSSNVQVTAADDSIRVGLAKLDTILNLAAEGAVAQARLRNALENAGANEAVLDIHRQTEALLLDMQEQVMKLRMVSVGPLFRRFARVVRDLAREHNKQVHLELKGEDVELDTTVVRAIRDPLTHMIRNAIDHGIETADVRTAAGKNACGKLTLSAAHAGGEIVVTLQDDGAGLQRDRILRRAVELGLVRQGQNLADAELCEFIFHPGFSTAHAVSDLSGRGVGMDVVRRNIESIKGTVRLRTTEGAGTTIELRLPLTLAILEGFSVEAAGETLVIPMDYVEECTELDASAAEGSHLVDLRGRVLPWLRLRDAFGMTGEKPDRESVVVLRCGEQLAALAVDHLRGTTQAVVKPLGHFFENVTGLSGSTILGNGRVGLILDVPGLLKMMTTSPKAAQ